jgi:methyl-accepting chemotaxis protein
MFGFGLKHLKVWQKLTLMVAVMSMSIPVIFYLISTRDAATIDFAQNERYGDEYLVPTRTLYANAVSYRDLVSVVREGQPSYAQRLASLQKSIDQDLAAIEAVHTARGSLLANNVDLMPVRLNEMKAAWSSLKAESVQAGAPSTLHTAFVAAVGAFITQVGDSSNLILDPDIDTYYLMSAVVTMLPPLADDLGSARSLAAGVASRGAITNDERLRLAALLGRAQLNLDAARKGMGDSAFTYNKSLAPILTPALERTVSDIGAFQRLIEERLTRAAQVAIAPAEVFTAGTTAIDGLFAFYGLQLEQLDRLIVVRIAKFKSDRLYIIGATAAGVLVTILLTVLIARSLTGQIYAILQVFTRLGVGDFKARATVGGTDELGVLTQSLNAMLDNLTGLLQSRDERSRSHRRHDRRHR